jgi:hypothetical protein
LIEAAEEGHHEFLLTEGHRVLVAGPSLPPLRLGPRVVSHHFIQ